MKLDILIDKLKMETLDDQIVTVREQIAKKDLDYRGFLTVALKTECQSCRLREAEARMCKARFPASQTYESLYFDFQPGFERKLAALPFAERGDNVVLLDSRVVGKIHLLIT